MKLLPKDSVTVIWSIITALITALIVSFFLQPLAKIFWEHPKINAEIEMVTFSKEKIITDPDWEVKFFLRLSNSGYSPTAVEYKTFDMKIPQISDSLFSFDIRRTISIPGNTILYDTIKSTIPSGLFKPDFTFLGLNIFSPQNNLIVKAKFDTSIFFRISPSGSQVSSEKIANKFNDVINDSLSNKTYIVYKKYFIKFHDKVYENYLFPPNAKISHKIEDDKIYIEYLQSPYSSDTLKNGPINTFIYPMINPIFIPDPRIKDKVILPQKLYLTITYNFSEGDVVKTKFLKLLYDRTLIQHFYILKY